LAVRVGKSIFVPCEERGVSGRGRGGKEDGASLCQGVMGATVPSGLSALASNLHGIM